MKVLKVKAMVIKHSVADGLTRQVMTVIGKRRQGLLAQVVQVRVAEHKMVMSLSIQKHLRVVQIVILRGMRHLWNIH